ncbi:hypothetical protein OA88_03335 [Flavobacterium sp. JRM]|nr:hypothetical protein OA88_03335 [Flavobacterium sp. JRM]
MKKKIAIIGASYLQVPLILKAKEMGIETHCFAWEEGAVGKEFSDFFYPISILNKEEIYVKAASIGIDGITTIATDMAVPTICYVSEKLNLISNSSESASVSTDKSSMRLRFSQFDVLSPAYLEVDFLNEDFFKNSFFVKTNFPYIVKPVDRSGSRGVNKVNDFDELISAVSLACNESFVKKCIIEEYIEGLEVSVETISFKGVHYLLAVTDKVTTGPPFFVELAHHQPSHFKDDMIDALKMETFKALDALNIIYGAGHSEFKITKEGRIFIIEVGARMGGDFIGSHLVNLSTGYDFLKGVLDVALGNFEVPQIYSKFNSGIYFLCKETENIKPFFYKELDFVVERRILDEKLSNITNSNDRSGYLIYKSEQKIILK